MPNFLLFVPLKEAALTDAAMTMTRSWAVTQWLIRAIEYFANTLIRNDPLNKACVSPY